MMDPEPVTSKIASLETSTGPPTTKSSTPLREDFLEEGGSSGSMSTSCLKGYQTDILALITRGGVLVRQYRLDAFKPILKDLFKRVCNSTEVHYWWCTVKNRFPNNELSL